MSFFIRKGGGGAKNSFTGKKRKAPGGDKNAKKAKQNDNEEIDSEGSDIEGRADAGYESEDDNETAEEKRLRLARIYLKEVEDELKERGKGEDLDTEVAERLQEDVDADRGKLRKEFSDHLVNLSLDKALHLKDKNHKLSITCVVISPDSKHLYTASKDAGLVKWELSTGNKICKVPGGRKGQQSYHTGHCSGILALAVSSDSKYLASGDLDKLILLWDTTQPGQGLVRVHTFKGHRDAVSGLVFRRGHPTLYSCSWDRSIKIWAVEERAYVETLFGHQDKICGIGAGSRERCVTAGGRDGTARVWKIVEESQLVFNGSQTNIDSLAVLNEEHWVTVGEDGHLAVWGIHKKKPLATVSSCHGVDPLNGEPNWVSAVCAKYNSDTVLTGSRDGRVRVWKVGEGFRNISQVGSGLEVPGFVNSLSLSECGGWLGVGLGQEHRLGRWWRVKEAKNKVIVVPVPQLQDEEAGEPSKGMEE